MLSVVRYRGIGAVFGDWMVVFYILSVCFSLFWGDYFCCNGDVKLWVLKIRDIRKIIDLKC